MPYSFDRIPTIPFAASPPEPPVGSVIAFAGEIGPPNLGTSNTESQGWMMCDGRQLSVNDYPELFIVLGFRYVLKGEPSDPDQEPAMFRIPDLRGYFVRGVAMGTNTDPDSGSRTLPNGDQSDAVGSIQQSALMSHTHAYSQATTATAEPGESTAGAQAPGKVQTAVPTVASGLSVSNNESRPVNIYMYYIIKYTNNSNLTGAPLSLPPSPPTP